MKRPANSTGSEDAAAGDLERRPCKLCGEAIIIVRSAKGRRAPYNAASRLVAVIDERAGRVLNHVRGHESHFSTCPFADQLRRRRGDDA